MDLWGSQKRNKKKRKDLRDQNIERFGKQKVSMWIANQAKIDQTNQRSKNQSTTSIGIELDLIFFWDHHKWNWK
jgi:hypothetical protein